MGIISRVDEQEEEVGAETAAARMAEEIPGWREVNRGESLADRVCCFSSPFPS
jgi:hypothetical protein